MSQLLHILKFKLIGIIKLKLEPQLNNAVKNLASLLIYGGFIVGAFFFSYNVTLYLIEQADLGKLLIHRFLSMFLFVFFITVALANILISHSTLFKSPEVRFFMTQPVSHFKIFLVKLIDNFLYSSTTFFLIGFAILAGVGYYYGYQWYHYPLLLGIFLQFIFLAACLAVIILLLIVRLTEFISLKNLTLIFIAGYLTIVFLFFQSYSPFSLINNVLVHYPNIDNYVAGFDPWYLKYLPSHWLSEYMYYISEGRTALSVLSAGKIIFSLIIVYSGVIVLARGGYYSSWLLTINLREVSPASKRNITSGLIDLRNNSILPRSLSVVLKRDFIRFYRDVSQWVHFLLIILLAFVFLFSMKNLQIELQDPFAMTIVYLIVFLFNSFIVAAIALRFVYPMVSMEGEALWAVRSAPFNMRRIYLMKGIIAGFLLSCFTIALTYITMSSIFDSMSLMIFSISAQLLSVVTIVGLNLGLGSYFAQYKERSPVRVASSQGASLAFLIVIIYLLFSTTFFIPFVARFFEYSLVFQVTTSITWILPPLLMGSSIMVMLTGFSTLLGLRAIENEV